MTILMTKPARSRAHDEERTEVRAELKALLAPSFSPGVGLYVKGPSVGVFVSPSPAPAKDSVNLSVLLFCSLAPAPSGWLDAQAAGATLETCLRVLQHRNPEMRASACQRLEQLGDPEAKEALGQLERDDPKASVREAAAQALARLGTPRLCEDALAGIKLRLKQATDSPCEALALTDERGYAEFHAVRLDSLCTLEVVWPAHSLESLTFSNKASAEGWIAGREVAIRPEPSQVEGCFNVRLEFRDATRHCADSPTMPLARRDRHVYHLTRFEGAGQAFFQDLPVGDYEIIWPGKHLATPEPLALHAQTDGSGRERPGTATEPPWVVHPRDRRLLATVESDARGRVVITVESDDAALAQAKVQFRLMGETGEICLHKSEGACVARGVRYLSQKYEEQTAATLSLELTSPG